MKNQYPRNPIGLFALFISLCYGITSIIVGFNINNFSGELERLPLIFFIILFPTFVLGTFVYLVKNHHTNLYGPADYDKSSEFIKASETEKIAKEKEIFVEVAKQQQLDNESVSKRVSEILDKGEPVLADIERRMGVRITNRHVAVSVSDNRRVVIDAVAQKSDYTVLIETKYINMSNLSDSNVEQHISFIRRFLNMIEPVIGGNRQLVLALMVSKYDLKVLDIEKRLRQEYPTIMLIIYEI